MKIKNYVLILLAALAITTVSCKEDDPDPDSDLEVSVIKGQISYFDSESGLEGKADHASVKLHKGSAEKALKTVTTDDQGNYQINGILNGVYTVSAEYYFSVDNTTFTGRSDSITITKSDTIICDLHMEK
ncbi:MAG: carboxypeptidase-like regulatory domain-containing protein [Bacteroidales bacterium]|jgi:hypothetical protein|nr:carboxypeptidase-like regulatory domain-containing protein [Bacteroidales bacterium]MDD2687247.1 carboxypeptidase-like regulatory domain-containing protein [Bacteroidales bacterium]MDD3329840.1 carboxypeptidase-like regulatory domain-containing protein [Bacteroidales bacterium]MDD3691202.1 carboxypeptidase-like regulatory domain-containing protein [Bacteroidales bacterium]MDD4043957.1 carboxypeptidase-like regulatory domain-containing protein [Bacteroidales bacterium]